MTVNFLTVKNLFSAYLNQDFDLMFGTADDAIHAVLEQGAQDDVAKHGSEADAGAYLQGQQAQVDGKNRQ
jgi:hypothetical protein